jgi:ATP-binding cassette subfamily F protein 3
MVRIDKIAKYFGGHVLFEGLSLTLEPGGRIGLVGPNGAGKTTLFRMIAGQMEPDAGVIVRPKGTTVGYLPQDVGEIPDVSLLEFVLGGRPDIAAARKRLDTLTADATAAADDPDRAMEIAHQMGDVTHELEVLGGYDIDARARSILAGMGFRQDQFDASSKTLSGGWRVRLVLSRLLLQRPDILLLDEPTNHLDVPSVEWLEGFLGQYEGTVVVISHDRYFLNRLVTSIASIEPDGLFIHNGDYDGYEEALADRAESLIKAKAKQDREIAALERFVTRFRAKASKAKQVQSRVKKLEKIERVSTMESRKKVRRFTFATAPREGKEVVVAEGLAKAYGDNVVYESVDFQLFRGERVVLVGPNGQGKTTLLKMIVGETEPDAGTITLGHNVMPAYFGQHQVEILDLSKTALQEMEDSAPVDEVPRCRSILGAFLFTGEDVDKKIRVLSGGERNRLALAKLLLRPTNLLVLDEPTNHLDMDSRDTLLDALDEFPGTILFVSHDRHFINLLATRVVHIEGGSAKSYDGDYDYYHECRLAESEARAAAERAALAPAGGTPSQASRKEQRRRDADRRSEINKKVAPQKARLKELETDIAGLETRRDELSNKLADPEFFSAAPGGEIAEMTREYQTLAVRIDAAYKEWETISLEIEAIEQSATDSGR